MYTIYKATNKINGKSYIGFDSNWPKRRKFHERLSQKDDPKLHFHRALKKYGIQSFEWEVLFQNEDRDYTLKDREPHFISEHKTFEHGYNMTLGGEGNRGLRFKHTPEAREKIRIAQSINNSMTGRDPWNKGEPCKEETKLKISKANKGKVASNKGIPMSLDQKQKLSAHFSGKSKSEKWKESMRGKIPWNKGLKKV